MNLCGLKFFCPNQDCEYKITPLNEPLIETFSTTLSLYPQCPGCFSKVLICENCFALILDSWEEDYFQKCSPSFNENYLEEVTQAVFCCKCGFYNLLDCNLRNVIGLDRILPVLQNDLRLVQRCISEGKYISYKEKQISHIKKKKRPL